MRALSLPRPPPSLHQRRSPSKLPRRRLPRCQRRRRTRKHPRRTPRPAKRATFRRRGVGPRRLPLRHAASTSSRGHCHRGVSP
jgi:hypothetical protein